MADLPIASRAIVYVRTAGGDELPVHGPGSAMPRAPFGDAVGDLQPEIFSHGEPPSFPSTPVRRRRPLPCASAADGPWHRPWARLFVAGSARLDP